MRSALGNRSKSKKRPKVKRQEARAAKYVDKNQETRTVKYVDKNQEAYSERYSPEEYTPIAMEKSVGWFKEIYDVRMKRILSFSERRRVLDLGCGSGAYMLPVLQAGVDVYGIDYAEPFVDHLKRALPLGMDYRVKHGDISDMSMFDDEFFGFIYSISTMPYVTKRVEALSEVFRVLGPGGIAMLEFGNSNSMASIRSKLSEKDLLINDSPVEDIIADVERAGFKILTVRMSQIFPMFILNSDNKTDTLVSSFLRHCMSKYTDNGVLIDEAISSSSVTSKYAYKATVVALKSTDERIHYKLEFQRGDPKSWPSNDIDVNIGYMKLKPERFLPSFCHSLSVDQTDCRAVYAIMRLHDDPMMDDLSEQYRKSVMEEYGVDVLERSATKSSHTAPARKNAVSVVLPVYNGERYLEKALSSLNSQTLSDFELIAVDDGSTDGSGDALDRFKPRTGIKYRVIHQGNAKLPGALNRGFIEASGDKLTWVSADCSCRADMLFTLSAALDGFPGAGMAYSGFYFVNSLDEITGYVENQSLTMRDLMIRNPGNASFMYTREAMKATGIYNEMLNGVEDWDYWLRMSFKFPFIYVRDKLYYYRLHDSSMQSSIPVEINIAAERMIAEFIASIGGKIDLSVLYPSAIKHGIVPEAQIDFAGRLLTSRTQNMRGLAVMFLKEALNYPLSDDLKFKALSHLSMEMALSGNMDQAISIASAAVSISGSLVKADDDASRYLSALNGFIINRDPSFFRGFYPIWHSSNPKLFEGDKLFVY